LRILPDGSAVLEYYYTRTSYTITFVTNGGNAIDTITIKYQQTVTMPNASRDGFTFGGWFTDDVLSEQFTETTVSANTTLYAWWTEENKPGEFAYSGTDSITINGYSGSGTYLGVPGYIGGVPVTILATEAFKNHSELTEVVIPNTVTRIDSGVLKGCTSLTDITLPHIGRWASSYENEEGVFGYIFGKATSSSESGKVWQKWMYRDSQTGRETANDSYFYIPSSLRRVTITNDTSIPYGAFSRCSFIESISFTNQATSIEDYAFYECRNLLYINSSEIGEFILPNGITKIGKYAFYNCVNIQALRLDGTLMEVGSNAFDKCSSIFYVNYGGMMELNWNLILIGTGNDFLKSAERTYYKGTMKITLNLNGFSWTTSGYKIAVVFMSEGNSQWVEMTQVGSLYVCDIPDSYEMSEFKFVRIQGNELIEANIKYQTNTFTTIMNTNYKLTSWSAAEKY
jgi:uncharacterized repeat protein (TIGR02543 family)